MFSSNGPFDPVDAVPTGGIVVVTTATGRARWAGNTAVAAGKDITVTTSLPLDHSGLAVLPREECLRRLATARVGRVAFVSQGDPVILPVNHGLDGESVIFRTTNGSKLLAGDSELPVAFEVDGYDADRRSGWSVLVRGVAVTVTDPADVARLNLLGVWPWADVVERPYWVRIRTYSVTGRQTVHQAR